MKASHFDFAFGIICTLHHGIFKSISIVLLVDSHPKVDDSGLIYDMKA